MLACDGRLPDDVEWPEGHLAAWLSWNLERGARFRVEIGATHNRDLAELWQRAHGVPVEEARAVRTPHRLWPDPRVRALRDGVSPESRRPWPQGVPAMPALREMVERLDEVVALVDGFEDEDVVAPPAWERLA